MPSINVDLDYFDHPKTRRLVHLLGKGSEVLPIRLWVYCARFHTRDGRLTGYSAQEIETGVAWWGRPGAALHALVESGFLDRVEDGFQVHDWLDHAKHLVSYKDRAKKAAAARWGGGEADATSNASSIASSNAIASEPLHCNGVLNPPKEGGEKTKARSARAFVPPTLDEVRAHVEAKGYGFDPREFLAHYEANGWVQGKGRKPIVNWQAATVTFQLSFERGDFNGRGRDVRPGGGGQLGKVRSGSGEYENLFDHGLQAKPPPSPHAG